jgi:hypothetical protein
VRKDREKIGHRRRDMRGKARKRKETLRKEKTKARRSDKRERKDNRQRKLIERKGKSLNEEQIEVEG